MSRSTCEIRRCRKTTVCTETSYHTIDRGELYLYGAIAPEHDVSDVKKWVIIKACIKCAERYGLLCSRTRKQFEEKSGIERLREVPR